MSSRLPGFRFSSFSSSPTSNQNKSINNHQLTKKNIVKNTDICNNKAMQYQNQSSQHQHHQSQQQQQPQPQQTVNKNIQSNSSQYSENSLSGSETDVSTSNENLSVEQRYVLRNTPRVEPQGQENLAENIASGSENTGSFRYLNVLFWYF